LVILIALIALTVAAPVDEKKPEEKPAEKANDQVHIGDEKPMQNQTVEKKDEDRKGLRFPLPEPDNEGDLMWYGIQLMDRVEELHKSNSSKDCDKMLLSVGREYLRRVQKYIKETPEFKIMPILCRDSERLNSSKRWEIRVRPKNQRGFVDWFSSPCFPLFCSTDEQTETKSVQKRETAPIVQANSTNENKTEKVIAKRETDNSTFDLANSTTTHENVTEAPIEVIEVIEIIEIPAKGAPNFEVVNKVYYRSMGENFGRVLMKKYRQQKLEQEEIDYLNRWSSDESIHYGLMGIYCHEGENLEDISKRISVLIEEQQ